MSVLNPTQATAVHAMNLSHRYGSLIAVDRLTFSANFKEILFLSGPNGAGKTTLIKIICGLLAPGSGSVSIMGLPNRVSQSFPYSHIGYCPQHLAIWQDLTCYEQLVFMAEMYGLPSKKRNEMIQMLFDNFGCLDGREFELAGKLSGGMKRRLNLMLAMVHDPKILILDEPFVGLDIQSRFYLRQIIRSFAHKEGKAVMISTHNMDEASRLADRIAFMNHGNIIAIDTPSSFQSPEKPSGIGDVLNRRRSLEDVFIELTGWRLNN